MQPHQSSGADARAPKSISLSRSPHPSRLPGALPLLGFMALSMFGLNGCEAIKDIFKAGVWVGALVIIAIVAVIGGIAAMVTRK